MLIDNASTDWLCTKPVFYNEKTGAISYEMRDVIDYGNLSINAEGLRNYLRFGYSAYGQTIVDGVKLLDHSSHISKNADGSLTISQVGDIAEGLWEPGQKNSGEVFEMLLASSRQWADSLSTGDIVLPLSGGFDSRILAHSLSGRENVRTYSYGLSARQKDSFEVVKAKQVAKLCNLYWKQVDIVDFMKEEYLDRWYKLYGPSVHLHGMYQMDFYDQVLDDCVGQMRVKFDDAPVEGTDNTATGLARTNIHMLSGIIGDGWAGTVRIPSINCMDDLLYLGYTHGTSIEDDICLLKSDRGNEELFWEKNKDKLKDENWRVLYAMRFKMVLLHYLLKTPESMGMSTWSPFIEPEIAMAILNLDWTEKTDRIWQQREFEKLNMNFGWEKDKCDYNMVLDVENLINHPVKPLDVKLLGKYVRTDYVEEVNRQVVGRRALRAIPAKPRSLQNLYNKAVKSYNKKIDKALDDYKILASVERLLLEAEGTA